MICRYCKKEMTVHTRSASGMICKPCDSIRVMTRSKTNAQARIAKAMRRVMAYNLTKGSTTPTVQTERYCIDIAAIHKAIGQQPPGYVLDHIVPISWVDLTRADHMAFINHPDNLQYITHADNDRKGATITGVMTALLTRPKLAAKMMALGGVGPRKRV